MIAPCGVSEYKVHPVSDVLRVESLSLLSVESIALVEVPSEFFREYLEGAYLDILKAALKKELGAPIGYNTAKKGYYYKSDYVLPLIIESENDADYQEKYNEKNVHGSQKF